MSKGPKEISLLRRKLNEVQKKMPLVFESKALEAAEFAAIHLDDSTRYWLNKRSTGTLANSWQATLNKTKRFEVSAGAYSDLPYAAIHEEGGQIRSSRPGGSLAVPLTEKARNIGSPKNFPGLTMVKFRGPPLLVPSIRSGDIQAQYVLPKMVTIPATGYISNAYLGAQKGINEIIGNGVFEVMAGAFVFGGE